MNWTVSRQHNVPAEVARFVGREREMTEVTRLLRQTRLLTLTGTGGCGKTRLALRVAADLVPSFPDGVWLAQLASVADSSLVPRTVAATLGVRGSSGRPLIATLATALVSRRLLLVLDNCEHVIGASARLVETLLGACPQLQILATSREPLRLPGETVWRVPTLALPGEPLLPPDSLRNVEAVALFIERARARLTDFTLTDDNATSVVAVCRRLEGLPLAIELAAAQVEALAPGQIAERLDGALHLLGVGHRTVPRQHTLHATLDWSHELLTIEEQRLFRRPAVFAGDFNIEAVEGIGIGDGAECRGMVPVLTSLVAKSLIEFHTSGRETRYRLLEPVRQYAMEKLEESGEVDVYGGHAYYFLGLAESAEWVLMSARRSAWMERLAAERDNLRAALWVTARRKVAISIASTGTAQLMCPVPQWTA